MSRHDKEIVFRALENRLNTILVELRESLNRKLLEFSAAGDGLSAIQLAALLDEIKLLEVRIKQIENLLKFLERMWLEDRLDEVLDLLENLDLGKLEFICGENYCGRASIYIKTVIIAVSIILISLATLCLTYQVPISVDWFELYLSNLTNEVTISNLRLLVGNVGYGRVG